MKDYQTLYWPVTPDSPLNVSRHLPIHFAIRVDTLDTGNIDADFSSIFSYKLSREAQVLAYERDYNNIDMTYNTIVSNIIRTPEMCIPRRSYSGNLKPY